MTPNSRPLRELADLLRGTTARAVVVPDRQAPSTIYDLHYRLAITACAFALHAKETTEGRRIASTKLKLLQFVAIRPWLVSAVSDWATMRKEAQSSFVASHLRRGFLSDAIHDNVIAYLVARRLLTQANGNLAPGLNGRLLTALYAESIEQGLFQRERSALIELGNVKITNSMLEGW